MGDATLSNGEDTIIVKNTLVDASDPDEPQVDRPDLENFIPTAIVKPKYQKLSFDERQLPVCGSTDGNSWQSPSSTITTTPRKVQKHLPKSQKTFVKQTRKLVNRSVENCVDFDASDKQAISLLHHSEKDIDCSVTQNSIAIVQPLKKVIAANASVNMSDEKYQKAIDSSKNSDFMSHEHEQKTQNASKIIATNEITSRMSECGNNNFNASQKPATAVRDSDKKVPTKRKDLKYNSGKQQHPFTNLSNVQVQSAISEPHGYVTRNSCLKNEIYYFSRSSRAKHLSDDNHQSHDSKTNAIKWRQV